MSAVLGEFLDALFASFRNPGANQDRTDRLMDLYVEHVGTFDDTVLRAAKAHIIRTRKDPFLPTIAEVVEVCEHAKNGTLRDLADPEGARKRADFVRNLRVIGGSTPPHIGPVED